MHCLLAILKKDLAATVTFTSSRKF